jgi:hypothetical protein
MYKRRTDPHTDDHHETEPEGPAEGVKDESRSASSVLFRTEPKDG